MNKLKIEIIKQHTLTLNGDEEREEEEGGEDEVGEGFVGESHLINSGHCFYLTFTAALKKLKVDCTAGSCFEIYYLSPSWAPEQCFAFRRMKGLACQV